MDWSATWGETAGYRLPAVPLPSCPATVSQPVGELDTLRERVNVPDLSREGPFDIHRDRLHSDASPRSCQDSQGCPFRITSYDLEIDGAYFSPEYGVQLHDPRLLEYVGAPESARLLSRSPEYWVQHMGREKTLSAALQLQHDAGLILSNIQVLQQLVTALHGASANVMGAVRGHQPFPTHAMQHALPSCLLALPSCSPLHDGNGSVASAGRAGNTRTSTSGDVHYLHVLRRLLPGGASVSWEAKLD